MFHIRRSFTKKETVSKLLPMKKTTHSSAPNLNSVHSNSILHWLAVTYRRIASQSPWPVFRVPSMWTWSMLVNEVWIWSGADNNQHICTFIQESVKWFLNINGHWDLINCYLRSLYRLYNLIHVIVNAMHASKSLRRSTGLLWCLLNQLPASMALTINHSS